LRSGARAFLWEKVPRGTSCAACPGLVSWRKRRGSSMELELRPRTEQEVRIYFARTRDPEIQARIPQRSQTVEQALEDYRRSLAPGADSYGRTVWADGVYVGDVWCYCIHAEPDPDPDAMVSYCIFDKDRWG